MALASQTRRVSDVHKGLLRRPSQNSTSSPVVEVVDFCRNKPKLVELEKQLYSVANSSGNSQDVMKTCQTLLDDCENINEIFNVFCSCSWVDRYQDPIVAQLFYELINVQNGTSLLAELEVACEELLKVLTHLGTPNTLQFNVVSLLYNLSRLTGLPSSHQEAVQSYLEEIARALWPYSKTLAPNLWASEAFCDAQCDILKACGKFLEEKCPVNTERTFQMISGKLISGDISKYSRFRLLEIQELRSSGWEVSGATLNYYKGAYLKFINESRQDMLSSDAHVQSVVTSSRVDTMAESNNQGSIKPVTVLRIIESELRKSCEDMQQELSLAQDAIADEKDNGADLKYCSGSGCEKPAKQPVVCNGHIPHVSQALTDNILERAPSPSNSSEGSDDVFATSKNVSSENKVLPALHRGEFKKPRRPYKSDSSLPSGIESLVARTALLSLSDVEENKTDGDLTLVRSHSTDLKTSGNNSTPGLTTEACAVKTVVSNDKGQDSNTVSNVENITGGLNHSTENITENWRERKVSNTDKSHVNVDSHHSVTDNWRERSSVDLKEPQNNNSSNALCKNWRESTCKQQRVDKSQEDVNDRHSVSENWRERPSVDVKDPEINNFSNAICENWRERKASFTDKSQEDVNGHHSVTENWRETNTTSVDLKVTDNKTSISALSENWRGRKPENSSDFGTNGSHHENWRDRKSMSMDESRKDSNSNASQRTKRHSLGDIQLERQNSNEKGKGGFGLPKPERQDGYTEASRDDPSKEEVVEVNITEEESQGLKWWQLREIQTDTGCRIYHNREKCVITITGQPQQCKAAKKRAYSVIASVQEQFGALVPLSDEVLDHLQSEGCNILADRLALCSGASVNMINDTQLFISGHRNCVNLAKAQLAKIKVMLRYTDDPDVESPNQKDCSEEKHQQVEKLFAALQGRQNTTDTNSTDQAGTSTEQTPTEEGLSREFILTCALSPAARERPDDLSLERTDDWVKDIVLVDGRRGERAVLQQQTQKKGFGSPHIQGQTEPSTP